MNARAAERRAAWRAKNPEAASVRSRKQNLADYAKNKDKRLSAMRDKRRRCPELFREYERTKQIRHAERIAAYRKRQWACANKAERRSKLNAWRKANPDKEHATWKRTYEKHKAKHSARSKAWAKAHPESGKVQRDKRRARLLGARGYYTRSDMEAILRAQEGKCFYCRRNLDDYHSDHFVPLARGGSNYPENIVASCAPCNLSKGAKLPWEWFPHRFSEGCTPR